MSSYTMADQKFGKIIWSLQNDPIPDMKLDVTPSRLDGLDEESEKDLRIIGCELIQSVGINLILPQVSKNYIIHYFVTVLINFLGRVLFVSVIHRLNSEFLFICRSLS